MACDPAPCCGRCRCTHLSCSIRSSDGGCVCAIVGKRRVGFALGTGKYTVVILDLDRAVIVHTEDSRGIWKTGMVASVAGLWPGRGLHLIMPPRMPVDEELTALCP